MYRYHVVTLSLPILSALWMVTPLASLMAMEDSVVLPSAPVWAAIVAVYSSRYVSTLLDLLGLRSPERRSFDRLLEMNGITVENIVKQAEELLEQKNRG